mgnify:FL=1
MMKPDEWILTDDDCAQYLRSIGNAHYEGWMLAEVADDDTCEVHHVFINLEDYEIDSEDFEAEYLNPYGYANLEDVCSQYGDEWEQIVVECIMETELFETPCSFVGTFDECNRYIVRVISSDY